MKVIITDIDGVLNSTRTPNSRKFPYIVDPVLVERFRRLVERTQAYVVLSSTWRCDPIGRLAAEHFDIPHHEICPDMPGRSRRAEIDAWLAAHPEVQRFVVVDDEDDQLDGLPLFQTSARAGLTEEDCLAIERFLQGLTDQTRRRNGFRRWTQRLFGYFERAKN